MQVRGVVGWVFPVPAKHPCGKNIREKSPRRWNDRENTVFLKIYVKSCYDFSQNDKMLGKCYLTFFLKFKGFVAQTNEFKRSKK